MYQTVGHQGIEFIAQAMELPLYRRETKGKSNQREKHYVPQENDEVEDLYDLLTQVKVRDSLRIIESQQAVMVSRHNNVFIRKPCVLFG